MTQHKMVGWDHRLDGHEFGQAPGDCNIQGSLACCNPWGSRVRHDQATEQQHEGTLHVQESKGVLKGDRAEILNPQEYPEQF